MLFFANSFWVSFWSCIFHVFGFIFRCFSSSSDENSGEMGSDFDDVHENPDESIQKFDSEEMGSDQTEEKEIPKLDSVVESESNSSTSKYQFFAGNSLCSFIENPQTESFTIQEMFVISKDESLNRQDFVKDYVSPKNNLSDLSNVSFIHHLVDDTNSLEHNDYDELSGEEEVVKQGKTESYVGDLNYEDQEALSFTQHELNNLGDIVNLNDRISGKNEFPTKDLSSLSNSDDFWATIYKVDYSTSDKLLCDESLGETMEPITPIGIGDRRVDYDEDSPRWSLDDFSFDQNSLQLGDAKYIEIEHEKHIPSDEFWDSDDEEISTFDDSKRIHASKNCDVEDDQLGVDVLLEQKELIRRMKKEMRHLKINGLPTILEESESPRIEDDLRPLKIDERIGYRDRMDEIENFYKRYLDKMRKLDILSQQTMYAIGLLQLKNQDQFGSNKKVSNPIIKSHLAQNLWSFKLKKQEGEPMQKLIRDLQRDLEMVYIGQLCLSWEMLKWQHHKAEELQACDPDGFHQHNQVAGEFQKFQVLLQRFTEDEPFHQGSRVQHYVKTRCGLPGLLLVPLIKDDPRSEWRGKGEGGISISMLKDVIRASMCTFWEFLRADKDIHATTLLGIHGVHVDLQNPSDIELLTETRSCLQKKEKRLKELVRSGNCIVKKFQKRQDRHGLSHEMFLAQVELRLVSRVLSMLRLTTNQLLWCHKKVNKIDIVGRKVSLEPSFLLFPC